jgi:hypothetical protein
MTVLINPVPVLARVVFPVRYGANRSVAAPPIFLKAAEVFVNQTLRLFS